MPIYEVPYRIALPGTAYIDAEDAEDARSEMTSHPLEHRERGHESVESVIVRPSDIVEYRP